ncbi:MAG: LPS-assembly lipoprotein LptE [Candidatus Erwinia impunctatus]
MRQPIIALCICMTLLISGCNFHLRGTTAIPTEMKSMIIDTPDPYGPLARSVRQALRLNNVTLIDNPGLRKDVPSLRLLGENQGRDTASIFQDGKTAEYSLYMTINAQVLLPNKGIYPLTATVYRSFFDNPLAALAKDAEQNIVIDEMRSQAVQQLVRKLLAVHAAESDTKFSQQEASPTAPTGGNRTSVLTNTSYAK